MAKERDVKEWTLMFYFASDNPLAPGVVSQLKAIKDAGFHPQANVIAQFDPHTKGTPSHTFEVNLVNKLEAVNKPKVGFKSNDPYVRSLVFDKLWLKEEADTKRAIADSLNRKAGRNIRYNPPTPPDAMACETNPKKALVEFLEFCKNKYPARHYMLFILGHGLVVGNDLFLYDENTPEPRITADVIGSSKVQSSKKADDGPPKKTTEKSLAQNSLLLRDLGTVLKGFKDSIGDSSFELVGFHSCSMSGLEVAYQIKDTANYMLSSQGPAFVGSWPYKQILIRVFNDLDSEAFRDKHLIDADSLAARLRQRTDPVSKNIYPRLSKTTKRLLDEPNDTRLYHKKLFDALVKELNNLLHDTDPKKDAWVKHVELSPETEQLKNEQLYGMDQVRLNRMLLEDAFKNEIKKEKREKKDVKEMLTRIFSYCMFNSYDFQMAGYSYDMCLCDLRKLKDKANVIKTPLKRLSSALRKGLKDRHARKLILLAHLESQSYWREQYTDLYDFCFRFGEAFEEAYGRKKVKKLGRNTPPYANQKSRKIPEDIANACENVRKALRRGVKKADDELIVRCEYVGPTYQYSHGLSVFFPWSRPADGFFSEQYRNYAFSETDWDKFLDEYFKATMRKLDVDEDDATERSPGEGPDADQADLNRSSILERTVVEKIAGTIFNSGGQLSKGGSGDKTGDDCECPSIKNYPSFNDRKGEKFPIRFEFQP